MVFFWIYIGGIAFSIFLRNLLVAARRLDLEFDTDDGIGAHIALIGFWPLTLAILSFRWILFSLPTRIGEILRDIFGPL